jgi:hypothetical protein
VTTPDSPLSAPARLVLVVGSGRSGTSSMAGTLKHLGLRVPQPEVQANQVNPQGFFEPRWLVDFQNGLMLQAEINLSDARPAAVERAGRVCRDAGNVARLREWLSEQLGEAPDAEWVVKDPRTSWFQELWAESVRPLSLAARSLTMLRHPAEVSSSKQTYYKGGESLASVRAGNAHRIAGWINMNLAAERASRESPRVFVRYVDLLSDWRKTMQVVCERLELTSTADLDWSQPHPVDQFIDPSLRRHEVTWDELDVPAAVRDLADEVWVQLNSLADGDSDDTTVRRTFDALAVEYDRLYADAEGMARDSVMAAAGDAGPQARRRQAAAHVAAAKAATPVAGRDRPSEPKESPKRRPVGRRPPAGPAERFGRRVDRVLRGIRRWLRGVLRLR